MVVVWYTKNGKSKHRDFLTLEDAQQFVTGVIDRLPFLTLVYIDTKGVRK